MSLSFWLSLVAAIVQGVVLVWERLLPPNRNAMTALLITGALAAIGIAGLQAAPEFDHAYFVRTQFIIGDNIVFFFKSTATLDAVSYDYYSADKSIIGPYQENRIRKGTNSVPRIRLSPNHWFADIDADGVFGKVFQEIVIEKQENGVPVVTFSLARRKGTKTVLCHTPTLRFIPPC